jgi:hypothetical protein
MPQPAQVTSIEAVDGFKASLVVYVEKAGRLLDEVSAAIVRTRIWLETDRLIHWKNQVRRRTRELAQADQELLTARLSGMPEAVKARRMAAENARLALRQAEEGLDRVRHWIRRYETQVESQAKLVSQLRQTLAFDMTRAATFLQGAVTTLASYADLSPSPPSPNSKSGPTRAGSEMTQAPAPESGTGAAVPDDSSGVPPTKAPRDAPSDSGQDASPPSDTLIPGGINPPGAEGETSAPTPAQRKGPL